MSWPVSRKQRQNQSAFPVQIALIGVSWQFYPTPNASVFSVIKPVLTSCILTSAFVLYPPSRISAVPYLTQESKICKFQAFSLGGHTTSWEAACPRFKLLFSAAMLWRILLWRKWNTEEHLGIGWKIHSLKKSNNLFWLGFREFWMVFLKYAEI